MSTLPALTPLHVPRPALFAVLLASILLAPCRTLATGTFPLSASPVWGVPGQTVVLSALDVGPGGFDFSVYWNDLLVDTFTSPLGDTFDQPFVIPPSATVGLHTITVCISCGDPEFEFSGSVVFSVLDDPTTGGDFDAQVLTMEVTQGVRGELNLRAVPDGGPVIPDDGSIHVMNRRTVVRVYPWISLDIGATAPSLTCELRGYRDGVELPGSPLTPVNPRISEFEQSAILNEMRRDPSRTWNFVLPMEWVGDGVAPGENPDPVRLSLLAKVNPDGPLYVPERTGGQLNNVAQLIDETFVHVTGERSVPFRLFPILIEYTDTSDPDSLIYNPAPSMASVFQVLHQAGTLLPVPAGNNSRSNMIIMPPRWDTYVGNFRTDKADRQFRKQMVRRYFPAGDFDRPPRGDYYLFLFDGANNCSGHAYLETAFVKSSTCGFVFTHELTHAIGQSHAGNGHGEGGGGGFDPNFPGSHGQVESTSYGFDIYAMTSVPPVSAGTPARVVHDFMSYGGGPEWISLYQWGRVAALLDAPEVAPRMLARSTDTWLMLSGRADATGSTLDPVFVTAAPIVPASGTPTPYALRFKDPNGIVLLEHPIADDRAQEFAGDPGYDFLAVAGPPNGWAWVEIVENDTVLFERFRSTNTPTVSLNAPVSNDVWPSTGTVTASWLASDADFDGLDFRLEGSLDGAEWFALHDQTAASQVEVDLSTIPAGDTSMFVRVQASDGLNVATSNLASIALQPRPPHAFVVQPSEGAQYTADQPIPLFGVAGDWQDGDLDGANLSWLVDGTWVANGNAHELAPLTPGVHTIELIAYNNLQLQGQAQVTIKVAGSLFAPELEQPPLASAEPYTDVAFAWEDVPGANGYRLQVSSDPQFAQLVLDYGAVVETSFPLGGLDPNATYYWRVRPQSVADLGPWSSASWFTTGVATGVGPAPRAGRWGFQLDPPSPNPFNPRTVVSFTLDHDARVSLAVFDARGRRVVQLADKTMPAGSHRATWEGRDDAGAPVASGTYFLRLIVEGRGAQVRKLVLIK